ncbi:hypothetical protein A3194_12615 [Candidatus Thiodiazotropha endoloripes]|uniref:tetratricopeptide repeat protein n=1 Tax=Candidatus Thiodiazotropha endoloripes TaxID=1818881 RepID=UPI00083DDD89|nr:tetratricopeptide repeat protein [Candidatus Thiodiazotropha endoloripes]ODB85669.1 hypothetical protein A3194_12615 [Candidatus Thiodiazotropha endoloripes]
MSVELERARKLEQFLDQDPTNTLLLKDIAVTYQAAGEHGKAYEFLGRLLPLSSDDPGLLNQIGELYLSLDHGEHAVEALERANQIAPNDDNLLFNLGFSYFQIGQTEKAVEIFEKLTSQSPQSTEYYYFLALAYDELGQDERSKACLEQLLTLDPKHTQGQLLSALNDLQAGDLDLSRGKTEHILRHQPNHIETLHLKAEIAFLDLDAQLAISTLRKAESIAPNDATTHLLLGQSLLMLQRNKQAQRAFETALKYDDQNLFAYLGNGWSALLQDNVDLAEEMYSRAVEIAPNEPESHVGLSVVACYQNNPELALKNAEHALSLNPEHVTAQCIVEALKQTCGSETKSTDLLIKDILNNSKLPILDISVKDFITRYEASDTAKRVVQKKLRHARMSKNNSL